MSATPLTGKRKAVFLDRDGTINREKEYLHRPDEFEFVPGAPEAIRMLKDAGFLVVVVTNQSGVGRGYYDEKDVATLHRHMDELLAGYGTSVDAYYFCPHHPVHGKGEYQADCDCRKPLPGMLLRAVADLGIELSLSWMVGDKPADVEAGIAAGCRTALVLTGYGEGERENVPLDTLLFADLLQAAGHISRSERD